MRKVKVRVDKVQPAGLQVKILENNGDGFIPRREFSWERSVRHDLAIPKQGDVLDAALLERGRRAHYEYLSIRQLEDPWQDAKHRYREGQIVRGEVVNIRNFAVFVQIEPGIDATIWPAELPLRKEQLPKDILSLGDQVIGIITQIDEEKRRYVISLTAYLRQISDAPSDKRQTTLENIFADRRNIFFRTNQHRRPNAETNTLRQVYHPGILHLERVLVIDDDPMQRDEISQYLIEYFEAMGDSSIIVDSAGSSRKALALLEIGVEYDLAVIDMRLGKEQGVNLAEDMLDICPSMAVVFTSSDPNAASEIEHMHGRRFPFAFKRQPDIIDWVDKTVGGYFEDAPIGASASYTGQGDFVQQLGMEALASQPLDETLQTLLRAICRETKSTCAMVLEANRMDEQASILAIFPPLSEEIHQLSLDGLYYSPLRDVIEGGETVHHTRRHKKDNRFRYFFSLLEYKACLGIPIYVPGFSSSHALFLLDKEREEFDKRNIESAKKTAKSIHATLERTLLLDYMHRYEQRYSQGQLLGSLMHELKAKLDGLGQQTNRLSILLRSTEKEKIVDAVEKIGQRKIEMDELVESYSRMAKGDSERVDLNEVARKVERQLSMNAQERDVQIVLHLQPALPVAHAIPSRLEQVVLNVMLNAVQQIQHHEEHEWERDGEKNEEIDNACR